MWGGGAEPPFQLVEFEKNVNVKTENRLIGRAATQFIGRAATQFTSFITKDSGPYIAVNRKTQGIFVLNIDR